MSTLTISNVRIFDSEIGFAAFQKKPEFGPASIVARDVEMENLVSPFLIEEESYLSVDEKVVMPNRRDVAKILYESQI
jgi:hypothetical protein